MLILFLLAGCAASSSPEKPPADTGTSSDCQSVRDAISREKLARNDAQSRGDETEAAKQRQAIELDKQVAASISGCDVSDLTG